MRIIVDEVSGLVLGTASGTMAAGAGQSIITVEAFDPALIGKVTAVEEGGIWSLVPIVPPEPGSEQKTAALLAFARDLRWRIETGGVLVGGVPVATDDRSKTMILGSRVAAMANPAWSAIWDGADGGSYPIDAPTMIAISDAVQAHINAAFAVFDTVKVEISAGTITTREQVEAAAWPPNI